MRITSFRVFACALLVAVVTLPLRGESGKIPEGFTPIFNGVDLTGWHVSKTNHHGTTPEFRVVHGVLSPNVWRRGTCARGCPMGSAVDLSPDEP